MIDEAQFDLIELSASQVAIVQQRKQACDQCNQCSEQSEHEVSCHAGRRGRLSLLYDKCPLRKWTGGKDDMPPRPEPAPEPPQWLMHDPVRHADHINSRNNRTSPVSELFVYGFPGLYAGANTELHHQILLWRSMGIGVHLIPGDRGYRNEPLYQAMIDLGVVIHDTDEFNVIIPGAPVFGFCNHGFLAKLDQILEFTHNTVFVNCMTWLFELEKQRVREGKLAALLYQNDAVRAENQQILGDLNPDPSIQYLTFRPYFAHDVFPWIEQRDSRHFTIGRISRHDADKFSATTLDIWNAVQSPQPKRG
ncbi:MAG: hypothetical protein MI861_10620, partial [Pirellulales bacterium]|nr:hypothetical protein [Pirellulales bacterium]